MTGAKQFVFTVPNRWLISLPTKCYKCGKVFFGNVCPCKERVK